MMMRNLLRMLGDQFGGQTSNKGRKIMTEGGTSLGGWCSYYPGLIIICSTDPKPKDQLPHYLHMTLVLFQFLVLSKEDLLLLWILLTM